MVRKIKYFFPLMIIVLYLQVNANILHINTNDSIKKCILSAKDYDTIVIHKGFYSEAGIVIDKPLTILGENAVIDAKNKNGTIFFIHSNNVNISQLVLKNVERASISDNAAVKLENVSNCRITNLRLENSFFGIYLAKSDNCFIENNTILGNSIHETNAGNGIHLWKCYNNTIQNNYITKHRDGIYFEFVKNSHIINNECTRNLRYGLHFMFSDSCSYIGNNFNFNGVGVAVMYTKNILMKKNKFISNWGPSSYGILLKDIKDSRITENTFSNNTVGIQAEGSNRILIEKNQITANGWAVKIMANCQDIRFTQNNFIANTFDIATNSTQNFNKFYKNYWSSYDGYDLNKDGYGDVAYHPVRLFSMLIMQQEQSIMLLHSFFITLLDMIEKIIPSLTPDTLIDSQPLMQAIV